MLRISPSCSLWPWISCEYGASDYQVILDFAMLLKAYYMSVLA
jgi:hypothetical protein